jgi:phage tail-like protein
MPSPYVPPPAFYFNVRILGVGAAAALLTGNDASFQEISGMQVQQETEDVAEGGENRFVHRLPKPAKYSPLVLKRGVVTGSSFFTEWVGSMLGANLGLPIVTQNLMVSLLNQSGIPSIAWVFVNAFPTKCDVAPLNSTKNEVLIETLELSYDYYERITLGSVASLAMEMAKLAQRFAP